jgi:hypothetical protein
MATARSARDVIVEVPPKLSARIEELERKVAHAGPFEFLEASLIRWTFCQAQSSCSDEAQEAQTRRPTCPKGGQQGFDTCQRSQ